ncbi:methyl-accepting chemotaxis protein [Altererythrobacter arenosus]|uniref:Methyl-accepting chemotaxis protein n=1 Tax=Altererythrobacter arenosus TaxID=3032592 RepID=A0ABY8G187_9SPHN|nr:methyl-accepting chemotaxis protein [Altererythrobacter sp. CAU 1644]WFL78184.1 methyl-accepting chemotaxis protein [Altererythrobacter sp. CAU 1644]
MSAIEDIANQLQFEVDGQADAQAPGDAVKSSAPWHLVSNWFQDLSLAGKMRTILTSLLGTFVLMGIIVAVGLSSLYGKTTVNGELKNTVISAADLKGEWGSLRYNTVRYILGSEQAALERVRATQADVTTEIESIERTIDRFAPQFSEDIDTLRTDVQAYNAKFEELRANLDTNGRDERSVSLAYELSERGDALFVEVDQFETDLRALVDSDEQAGLAYFFNMVNILLVLTILVAAIMFFSLRYIGGNLLKKIGEITAGMTRLAQGDRHFEIEGIERKDEIGEMLKALELFKRANIRLEKWAEERAEVAQGDLKAHEEREAERRRILMDLAEQFERTVGDVVGGVAAASSQLQMTATGMATSAEESTRQTAEVARSMEEANAGATSAAAASDEFAMSIGEISRQAASSAELARKATLSATEADTTISALSSSADQVGQIVELIQTIAQRTNLLALNASIEAARGGEAGRGFAVVASEVKELAMQTSRATEQVAEQIRAMQDSTGASVGALRTIVDQIQQLESTAVSIASAVDQQSVAGQDLARSIDLAARSTDKVSSHIDDVRELSLSTGAAAAQVLSSATELEGQASTLRSQMQDFLGSLRRG